MKSPIIADLIDHLNKVAHACVSSSLDGISSQVTGWLDELETITCQNEYIPELEKTISNLKDSNRALMDENIRLHADNAALQEHIDDLENDLTQANDDNDLLHEELDDVLCQLDDALENIDGPCCAEPVSITYNFYFNGDER